MVGKKDQAKKVINLALDRIVKIEFDLKTTYMEHSFNGDDYYKNTIGVSVLNDDFLEETVLKVDAQNAPYVLTKPFHASQELLEKEEDGSILISVKVHLNFEFERLILGFGDSIKVISPPVLRNKIQRKLSKALNNYKKTKKND